VVSQSLLFLQACGAFTRTLASTCIGASTLTTHGQATAVAETTVATNVHQTLDVHGCFATQVTFNGDQCDLIANFFQVAIRQIFDLLGISNA